MSNQYITSHYKGKYRILPEICRNTNDFPRNARGEIEDDAEVYIACQYGNRIEAWGLNESRRMVLMAYIPSLQRGRNIKKELKKQKVEIFDYDESDCECVFKFMPADIEIVASLLKAKVSGASISPWSKKNLPKATVDIPEEELDKYKAITSKLGKTGMLLIKTANQSFLDEVLAKKLKKKGRGQRDFDYHTDMKNMMLSRDVKGYIYKKNLWNDYLEYLDDKVNESLEGKR